MSYRVKTVSQLTGIPRNTLVAWERRYQLLDPTRTEGGYRVYRDEEVAYLKDLKQLVDRGLSISEAIAQRGPLQNPGGAPPLLPTALPPPAYLLLADHLGQLDREGVRGLLRQIEQMPFEDAVHEVWFPFLKEVGDRWEDGELSVAQEHFCSGVAREYLLAMFRSVGSGVSGNGPQVVCASVPQELHDLPLLCLAVLLALRGWRVTWLGASVPVADLCAVAAGHAPDVICLSAIVKKDPIELLSTARTVLSAAPKNTVVVLGGPAAVDLRSHEHSRLWIAPDFEEFLKRWAHLQGVATPATAPTLALVPSPAPAAPRALRAPRGGREGPKGPS